MALAKKGSRLIAVEHSQYRWVVSPDSGYLVVVIEKNANDGQRLEAYIDYIRVNNSLEQPAITPGSIRAMIQQGIAGGWKPDEPGLPPFRLLEANRCVQIPEV